MARKTAQRTLSAIGTAELQRELSKRRRRLPGLQRKLARAEGRVREIREQIAALGIVNAGTGRIRPKNDMNLVEALAKLLKGKQMSVTEATSKVQEAGYKTSAANFRTIVNQTLIKSNRFKKISRGQYTTA